MLICFYDLATDVEGIFRLNGSNKRIKELQTIFDSPDRYGKGLDWTGYTVHDAANILRRYLNLSPQPIVPLDFYEKFREPLRSHQTQAVGDMEAQAQDIGDFDQNLAIITYQRLITELPPLSRQLLLYILDLLAVFASKSDLNRMTSANLAAIFQPGLLSHPTHDMKPPEYRLSQDVLIFLIENQDSFLIGMSGTAADEKTVKEVQGGVQRRQNSTPMPTKASQALGRSTSNASAGADSLRKFGIRRNVSVSSRNSKHSANVPSPGSQSPGTPIANNSPGVHRSNTLPTKRSPALSSSRWAKSSSPQSPTTTNMGPGGYLAPTNAISSGSKLAQTSPEGRSASTTSSLTPTAEHPPGLAPIEDSKVRQGSKERLLRGENINLQPPQNFGVQPTTPTPTGERKLSHLLNRSPAGEGERRDSRIPNKLKKKRLPGSANVSAQSSTASLHNGPDSPANQIFYTPMPTPGVGTQQQSDPLASMAPVLSNTDATPLSENPPQIDGTQEPNHLQAQDQHYNPFQSFKPSKSSNPSLYSRSSITDQSEADHTDDPANQTATPGKRHRWRLSSSTPKRADRSTSRVHGNAIAENSTTSVGSLAKPRKSMTNDSHQLGTEASTASTLQYSSNESTPSKDREALPKEKESPPENSEKKGPFGWLKSKSKKAREEKREREAERERAKSPRPGEGERRGSKLSFGAGGGDGGVVREERSVERSVEENAEGSSGVLPLP